MSKIKKLIVIVGPTAIGKTSLSIYLAHQLNCEIVSADSRQFYKELAIGTAKPNQKEMDGVAHHFIDSHSIYESYNVGQYEIDAIEKIAKLHQHNDYVILVGGSGLYVDAVCKGIDDIPSNSKIRESLTKELETMGLEYLQNQLLKLDPEHYNTCNLKNPQRLIRALEVCKTSGKTYTSFRSNKAKERPFDIIKIGLDTDRTIIYNNINERVDLMLENGLIEEAKSVFPSKHLNALNTVGYKELFAYFEELLTKEEAIEKIKKNTRNFAKRQLTWFRRDQTTHWFAPNQKEYILKTIMDS